MPPFPPCPRWAVLLAMTTASACAHLPPPAPGASCPRPPVVLVHGLDDTVEGLAPLAAHLAAEGFCRVEPVGLVPNDGRAPLLTLAGQVAEAVARVREETGAERVDLVGFSMGALVGRTFLLRGEGHTQVRRFVSISGPHAGTLLAWLRANPGARDMRPGSALLQGLAREAWPPAGVDVFSVWTPWDLMIVPATSSRLPGAHERTVPVLLHPLMLSDGRVLRAVAEALSVARPEDFARRAPSRLPPGL